MGLSNIRVRAAGVLIGSAGVLVQRKIGDDVWALPGGGVNEGESAADALQREFCEELVSDIDVVRRLDVLENFFAYEGKICHSVEFYFLVSCDALVASGEVPRSPERDLEFAWWTPTSDLRLVPEPVVPLVLDVLRASDA
ncbi:NUDIX domain-containing protein [Austwickia sp. TVS 96-490-7B]|uniref:NUDIX domain-containing protein n=1 Tax=Austwickia sp. TVS 96-490-7B TaxID=2830843 RepID=UPI001C5A4835